MKSVQLIYATSIEKYLVKTLNFQISQIKIESYYTANNKNYFLLLIKVLELLMKLLKYSLV